MNVFRHSIQWRLEYDRQRHLVQLFCQRAVVLTMTSENNVQNETPNKDADIYTFKDNFPHYTIMCSNYKRRPDTRKLRRWKNNILIPYLISTTIQTTLWTIHSAAVYTICHGAVQWSWKIGLCIDEQRNRILIVGLCNSFYWVVLKAQRFHLAIE